MRVPGFRTGRVDVSHRLFDGVLGIRLQHYSDPGPRVRVSTVVDADGFVQTCRRCLQRRAVCSNRSVIIIIFIYYLISFGL